MTFAYLICLNNAKKLTWGQWDLNIGGKWVQLQTTDAQVIMRVESYLSIFCLSATLSMDSLPHIQFECSSYITGDRLEDTDTK